MKHAFTECEAGQIGPRCEIVCPYPMYGKQCLSKCNCSKDHCDPADGCIGIHAHMYFKDFDNELILKHSTFNIINLKRKLHIISAIWFITVWTTQDSLAGHSTTVSRSIGFNGKIHFQFLFCI